MSNVIDLSAERDKRNGPAPEFRCTDTDGFPMFAFLAEYEIDGRWFGISFYAYDLADADSRIAAIKESLSYRGQIMSVIDA